MEGPKAYVPSEGEVKKAEETMDAKQKEASDLRESMFAAKAGAEHHRRPLLSNDPEVRKIQNEVLESMKEDVKEVEDISGGGSEQVVFKTPEAAHKFRTEVAKRTGGEAYEKHDQG